MLSGRALAAALLGWSLLKVVAKLLFTRQQPGLELFLENYGAEGLGSIDGDERDKMERFSRCIACGRCDIGEAQRIRDSDGAYPGLMQLVLASTRSMPDYDAAERGFACIPRSVLEDKVKLCPVQIPFAELADFVAAHAVDTSTPAVASTLEPATAMRRLRPASGAPHKA